MESFIGGDLSNISVLNKFTVALFTMESFIGGDLSNISVLNKSLTMNATASLTVSQSADQAVRLIFIVMMVVFSIAGFFGNTLVRK
jgi:hypothetical protein